MDNQAPKTQPMWRTAVAVSALAFLVQLPLIFNAGYFSHDELQWAAFADLPANQRRPLWDWAVLADFQYRPLTFELWMRLSRHLFAFPPAFHAVLVAWGAVNAAMLAALARGLGVAARPAAFGALAFVLGPYAVYVHGWVGTIADLIWGSCALLIGIMVVRMPPTAGLLARLSAALAAGAMTAVALLGKEAAVSIPALLAVAWWFDGRKRAWGLVFLASALVVAAYLALRADALLHASAAGTQYVVSVANLPLRWLEYQLFPWNPTLLEPMTTFARGPRHGRVVFAVMAYLVLLAGLWRSGPRYVALFIVGGIAALGPVLVLSGSSNQYAYAFAALTATTVAAAWSPAPGWGRAIIVAAALVNLWHGVNVMREIRDVGRIQAEFSPALAEAVKGSAEGTTLRLKIAPKAEEWIFQRLTSHIPRYRGVAIGDRVRLVGDAEPADYLIEADGRLIPIR
jgi:hypothetical protein